MEVQHKERAAFGAEMFKAHSQVAWQAINANINKKKPRLTFPKDSIDDDSCHSVHFLASALIVAKLMPPD